MVVSLDTFIFGCFPGDERPHEEQRLLASVEEALRLGASAVKVLLVLGKEDAASYSSNLAYIGRVAERCHEWGMPLMVEPAPWGKQARHRQSAAAMVAAGVRIAVELGADLVKTTYPGDAEVFRSIVAACPVPVCILGGPKVESQEQLMEMIRKSVEAGGAGVVFGRNIWQANDPAAVIEAMKRVIHAPGPRR
jgi:DhnA family fructose-bisphosphate aldolase class Ia